MRLWYARRGVPWTPLLACLGLSTSAAVAVQLWASISSALLPGMAALCAAGAGFVLDEPASAATNVTPRGQRWAVTTRVGVGALPAGLWLSILATMPQAADVNVSAWILTGLAGQVIAVALAWFGSARGNPSPGASVAAAVAGATLAPFVIGPFLGWNGF